MAWGESGSGTKLVLDYAGMCNNLCKCNGQDFHCTNEKKRNYRMSRCRSACIQWFPNDTVSQEMCKGYCVLPTDNYYANMPASLADFESGKFQKSGQSPKYNKAPYIGVMPGTSLSWPQWRNGIFQGQTQCGNTPSGGGPAGSPCDQKTGYFSNYINGVYYGLMQPVSTRQLYSYSNPYDGFRTIDSARNFCDNLRYANGKIVPPNLRPLACGGTGPDFSPYNPVSAAIENMQPEIDATTEMIQKDMDQATQLLTIFWIVVIFILIVMALMRFV